MEPKPTKTSNGKKVVIYYVNFPEKINDSQVNLHGENTHKTLEEFKSKYSAFSEYDDVIELFLPTFFNTRVETINL